MRAIFLLALRDMKKRWGLALVLTGLFAIVFAAFLILFAYYKSATQMYSNLEENWLVVGSSDGLSEIHGSRLTPEIRKRLVDMGYADPVPEIHQIVGTNLANGTLVKGIRLEDYLRTNSFTLMKGRKLEPDDLPRLAMVGDTLANIKEITVGDDVLLRGRKFKVVGIFKTGSLQDNEAWISLSDAQNLLNYGEDVSLYLIPDSGPLRVGDLLQEDVLVSQKGESGGIFNSSVTSFLSFYGVVGALVGIASAITLGNMLFRLAYLRRQEFGILKSIGFGFNGLAFYFFIQAGTIIIAGIVLGVLVAILIITTIITSFSAFGFGLNTNIDFELFRNMSLLVLLFFSIAAFIPLISVYRKPIPDLLGRN